MITIKAKDVKDIIKATFPDYRKRNVFISTGDVTLHDLNWSGGTRSEYRACSLDGKSIDSKYNMSTPAPWNNQFEGLKIDVPENVAIVAGGYFCGKTRTLTITVHPNNMPKLID